MTKVKKPERLRQLPVSETVVVPMTGGEVLELEGGLAVRAVGLVLAQWRCAGGNVVPWQWD